MLWTILYSPFVLYNRLPPELYEHWLLFSQACSLLCNHSIGIDDVDKADKLLVEFCRQQEVLYGTLSCTPNMHMHCHIKECVMDVGPIHCFWCFSFEKYNEILEKMQKHGNHLKFSWLINFAIYKHLHCPLELRACFTQMKTSKTSLPVPIMDGLAIMTYEENLMCLASDVCAIRLPYHEPVPPGREKYMREEVRDMLKEMYDILYGIENVVHVPLQYVEFSNVKVFNKTYLSEKSRAKKSPAIIAAWSSVSDILTERHSSYDDLCVGTVKYFLCHSVTVKVDSVETNKSHILVCINWNEDHPQKYLLGNGIIISAKVCQSFSSASFLPVSRIMTQCAIID